MGIEEVLQAFDLLRGDMRNVGADVGQQRVASHRINRNVQQSAEAARMRKQIVGRVFGLRTADHPLLASLLAEALKRQGEADNL